MNKEQAAEAFLNWLEKKIIFSGRGDEFHELDVEPSGKFWFGRIAPQSQVTDTDLGERGERLEPCAIGMRINPKKDGPWSFSVTVSCCVWVKDKINWKKTKPYSKEFFIEFSKDENIKVYCEDEISNDLAEIVGIKGLSAGIHIESKVHDGRNELIIQLVNTSPKNSEHLKDTRLYETSLEVKGIDIEAFQLEALRDAFRYERDIFAYGINTGVAYTNNSLKTIDSYGADKMRPKFWPSDYKSPDFNFVALSNDPLTTSKELLEVLQDWGNKNWSLSALSTMAQSKSWTKEMFDEAKKESVKFEDELKRIKIGISYLENDSNLNKAFCLMNKAMSISSQGKYDQWRPFQFGFLLANLQNIANLKEDSEIVDIVWFATGGGKTETYLGLLLTAAFFDRLRGKTTGMTAWSRFPLRMLSLQQTQRFANALAAAELVRIENKIDGDAFSMGFFVGQSSTPNTLKKEKKENDIWDIDDLDMPNRLRVLQECPFCRSDKIEMAFNRRYWKLEHRCKNTECSWKEESLPFYIVDDEIYRFLPTVIVGTLDKAASIAMQASMRGFVGAPWGKCSKEGHGYTYAKRSTRKTGCLVPDCKGEAQPLVQDLKLYGPSFRLQDELHLLRDSLGAVDAHYEALFDGMQKELCGHAPKILASSATLTGYEKQSEVLYRRKARVFPQPPPSIKNGFWNSDSDNKMRRYMAVAPRGVTIEYTVDRLLEALQRNIRLLVSNPSLVCSEACIPEEFTDFLISNYGTNVIYGNTLKDIDAVTRSIETQLNVEGMINTEILTGKTAFDEVRNTLYRLDNPEADFYDRLHLISASSMMSHGVDVDRLNIMVMLGLPLGSAEFIQATARVGRKYPGLVFVIHKIGRERDASIFRSFEKFVEQSDRFVESIPITRKSRRVLEKTISGMEQARLLIIHEPKSGIPLTTVKSIQAFLKSGQYSSDEEIEKFNEYLELNSELDEPMRNSVKLWFKEFIRNIQDPPSEARFYSHLSPTGEPMTSLRDVEEQVPIYGSNVK